MKTTTRIATPATLMTAAEQVPLPRSAVDVTPAATGVTMPLEYARAMGRTAYIWGWPLVNQMNRRANSTRAPYPGLINGTLPVAPRGQLAMLNDYIEPDQRFVACLNQDVVYGLGYMSLDEEPVVVQVPEFDDRFWVYAMYDARTDQFSKMGKPYGTRPGFYLIAGPNWTGKVPSGIAGLVRSSTEFGMIVPRVFQDDVAEDRKAIQRFINQIVLYPLDDYDGKMKTVDWSKAPTIPGSSSGGGEIQWVVPETFFDQLGEVLAKVPPLPGEEGLYGNLYALLDAAAKDSAIKQVLVEAAVETECDVISRFLQWRYNGRPAGNGWNRSTNNAQWGTDYVSRTGTARSNIYGNKPDETQYFYTDGDSTGIPLAGKSSYAVTFAKGELPPVNGFWSMTLYDQHHFFSPNDLNRYSLGTKNQSLEYNADGSLTLYAGAASPGKDKESNWLPAPAGPFSLYIRAYWGKQPILDGSWKPPVVEKIT